MPPAHRKFSYFDPVAWEVRPPACALTSTKIQELFLIQRLFLDLFLVQDLFLDLFLIQELFLIQ
jgi:hypothetical protein